MRSSTETSMMFITPTPPMPSVSVPTNASSTCKSDRQRINHRTKFVAPKHLKGFRIGRRKLLAGRHCGQHLGHRFLFKLRSNRLEYHDGCVTRVPKSPAVE